MPTTRAVLAALALIPLLCPPARALDCAGGAESDRIVAIPARGEVLLESGRTLRLAGVRLADAGPVGAQARAALDALVGAPASVRVHEAGPDRWGRLSGEVALAGGGDLAEALVGAGLAAVDSGPLDGLCRPGLLDVEEAARRAGAGLWADAAAGPVPARDRAGIEARAGEFALVEGVVARVGVRSRATYLDFGRRTGDFAVVAPEAVWRRLEAKGLGAAALEGRRIRARGIIELRPGPAIRLGAADMIEILEPEPPAARRRTP